MKGIFENLEVKLTEVDLPGMGFKLGGIGLGGFYLEVYSLDVVAHPIIARLEGNENESHIKYNHRNIDEVLLREIFQMCRCFREYKRSPKNQAYNEGYKYFRERAVGRMKMLSENSGK